MSDVTICPPGHCDLGDPDDGELPVAFCMFVVGFLGLWIIRGVRERSTSLGPISGNSSLRMA